MKKYHPPYTFIKNDRFYVYSKRSCANCYLKIRCKAMVWKDWSMDWLDLAKEGCKLYYGDFNSEKRNSMSETNSTRCYKLVELDENDKAIIIAKFANKIAAYRQKAILRAKRPKSEFFVRLLHSNEPDNEL